MDSTTVNLGKYSIIAWNDNKGEFFTTTNKGFGGIYQNKSTRALMIEVNERVNNEEFDK